jgi:predicted transposase/invertase (TIGR01784 family)
MKREYALGLALDRAVAYCLEHDILKDFIIRHGGKLMNLLRTEFNINTAERIWKEEAMAEGLAKGKEEKSLEIAKNLITLGLSVEQIALVTQLDVATIKSLCS